MSNKNIDFILKKLEWESFKWPLEITNLESLNKNYTLPKNALIKIHRDESFKLTGKITGITSDQNDLEYNSPKNENIIQGDTIIGYDIYYQIKYEIKGFYIDNISLTPLGKSPKINFHFNCSFILDSLESSYIDDFKINKIIEFHLTGKIDNLFPRSTNRSKEEIFLKTRENDNPHPISFKNRGMSRDSIYIKNKDLDITIQLVDNSLLPYWANGIQLEFREQNNQIPNKETRTSIAEIIGFIIGNQFLKIGESHFDFELNVFEQHAYKPLVDNVISKCKSFATPPINFRDFNDWQKIERVLTSIIPKYLKLKSSYQLNNVLWKYWIADELAIGTNLPILSSALEGLVDNYIKVNNLNKRKTKKEKGEYQELITDSILDLETKLQDYDFSKKIIDKIKNPFNLGIGEKLNIFFDNINIDINNESIENEALKARNKMAHSNIGSSYEECIKYIKLSKAYKTFVNRIILKILDYNGSYIDYYNGNNTTKKMNENL